VFHGVLLCTSVHSYNGISDFEIIVAHIKEFIICFPRKTALTGQNFLIIEASQSHSDTPHLIGFLWTSDKPVAEIST